MVLNPYVVTMEFKVLRRISWDGELGELRAHLDAVCEHLDEAEPVAEWKLSGDLETAALELALVVVAASPDVAESAARNAVAAAIRDAGARHDGLLSLREESEARIRANAWHGLRTPRWQPRRVKAAVLS